MVGAKGRYARWRVGSRLDFRIKQKNRLVIKASRVTKKRNLNKNY
jgi:hypothetical protein